MPNLTQDYARFINELRVEVHGASDAGIYQVMFGVFHEFFETTNAWQEDINVAVVADEKVYQLTVAEGGEFKRLLGIVNENGTNAGVYKCDLTGLVTFRDFPNAAAVWVATVAKTVGTPVDRDGKPQVPDWTFAQFYNCLYAGVVARLMLQPKKPFTNLAMARMHWGRFRDLMGDARNVIAKGNRYGVQAWSFPQGDISGGGQRGRQVGSTDTSFGG